MRRFKNISPIYYKPHLLVIGLLFDSYLKLQDVLCSTEVICHHNIVFLLRIAY